MVLNFNFILNFVVFSEGVTHNSNQHVEEMQDEDKGRDVIKESQDLALNVVARVEA